jgi:ATP-dependent protease Clp ATPase subunit
MEQAPSPQQPEDARVLFEILSEDLAAAFGTLPETPQLALLATRHLIGEEMLRLTLIGDVGSGKTYLARTLAKVIGSPFLEMNVTHMAEEGWKGAGPSEHLTTLYAQAVARTSTETAAIRAAQRAVILIDELDQARLAPGRASPSTREDRVGKQLALLPIVGDGTVTIERSSGAHLQWRSRGALVVCTGVFDGLPAGDVSAESLADWGLLPELAERLAFGGLVRVSRMRTAQLVHVLQSELQPLQTLFARFGYGLDVSEAAVTYAISRLSSDGQPPRVRSTAGVLRSAAEALLLRMLDEDVPIGAKGVLGPDDLRIPPRSPGLWRE